MIHQSSGYCQSSGSEDLLERTLRESLTLEPLLIVDCLFLRESQGKRCCLLVLTTASLSLVSLTLLLHCVSRSLTQVQRRASSASR